MAFTQTDIDALDAAIVQFATTGESRVRFSDGREVQYRSIEELLKARDAMTSVAAATTSSKPRCSLASFRKE